MLTGDILRNSAQRHPQKAAVIHGARTLSYGTLEAEANRFANALLGHGLGKGDVIAVMSRNLPEYLIIHFGNARTGCLLVNLSPAYAVDEIEAILRRTDARLVLVEADFQGKIDQARGRIKDLEQVVVIGDAAIAGAVPFDQFLAGFPDTPPEVALDASDPFAMTFTGGTTGAPKGALVTHACRVVSAHAVATEHDLTADDIAGAVTPLYHAAGLVTWLHGVLLAGATCVMQSGWDAAHFADLAEHHRMSAVMLVPVQLREFLDLPGLDAKRLANLKKISCAGATSSVKLIADLHKALPRISFSDHYGSSETGLICMLKPGDPSDKWGTIGRPVAGVDLQLIGPDGEPVGPGEVGEMVVGGPFMMAGYFNDSEESAAYFRSGDGRGWTGDLATRDSDGFLTLVGRSKDMIVSGAVNIYPREVELVLESHPFVRECTVFGIPDEKWGETLVAYVVRKTDETLDADLLTAFCTEHLARFKRPRIIRFVNEIPKTPSGKVQKPILREAFLNQQ